MTKFLFNTWILHFLESMRHIDNISSSSRHIFILDGHNSHVTLEVVKAARRGGLDLVSLPSYMSQTLQPLDVFVFKPFMIYFRKYCNYWTSRNVGQKTTKEILAHWVSLVLQKVLCQNNIEKGFSKIGILSPKLCSSKQTSRTIKEFLE